MRFKPGIVLFELTEILRFKARYRTDKCIGLSFTIDTSLGPVMITGEAAIWYNREGEADNLDITLSCFDEEIRLNAARQAICAIAEWQMSIKSRLLRALNQDIFIDGGYG